MKITFMKSTVLAAVLFLSAHLGAQVTNEIRDPQVNNNVVTYDTLYFYIAPNVTHQYHLDAYNVSSAQQEYKVEKLPNVMPGAQSWFCIFHNGNSLDPQSVCFPNTTTTPPDVFATDPGDYNLFECDFYSGPNYGISYVHYRIYNIADPADTANFTLVYNVSPASVGAFAAGHLQLSEAFPNPSNGVVKFTYNIGENVTASMHIYDIEGRIVRTETITRSAGELTLDIAELPAGVYSCMLLTSEGAAVTRRVVIAE